jgi:hypothetical protein
VRRGGAVCSGMVTMGMVIVAGHLLVDPYGAVEERPLTD